MVLSPLRKLPLPPDSPFEALMRRAPAAANTDGKLTLVESVTNDATAIASERFALRGLFSNSLMLVGVGGLIQVKPISITTQGRPFSEEFLAEFDEVARLAIESSTLQIQIEQYKRIGLLALVPFLQDQLENIQSQLQTVARGYGTPTVTGALNMVASASDGQPTSVDEEFHQLLKSDDPVTQLIAWGCLYARDPDAAQHLTADNFGPQRPVDVTSGFINVTTVKPAHGLFHAMVTRYVNRLERLVVKNGQSNRELVLREYLSGDTEGNPVDPHKMLTVIHWRSGTETIWEGHHHVAGLVVAARLKIIPESWLQAVPGDIITVPQNSPLPEALALRIVAPLHTLSMRDLLSMQSTTP